MEELTPKQKAAGWKFVPIPVEQVKEWPVDDDSMEPSETTYVSFDAVISLDDLHDLDPDAFRRFIEGEDAQD